MLDPLYHESMRRGLFFWVVLFIVANARAQILTNAWTQTAAVKDPTTPPVALTVTPDGRSATIVNFSEFDSVSWEPYIYSRTGQQIGSPGAFSWEQASGNVKSVALDTNNNLTVLGTVESSSTSGPVVVHQHFGGARWNQTITLPMASLQPLAVAASPANGDILIALYEHTASSNDLVLIQYTENGIEKNSLVDPDMNPSGATPTAAGEILVVGTDNSSTRFLGGQRAAVYDSNCTRTWTTTRLNDGLSAQWFVPCQPSENSTPVFALNFKPNTNRLIPSYTLQIPNGAATISSPSYPGNVNSLCYGGLIWANTTVSGAPFLAAHDTGGNQLFSKSYPGGMITASPVSAYWTQTSGRDLYVAGMTNSGMTRLAQLVTDEDLNPPMAMGSSTRGAYFLYLGENNVGIEYFAGLSKVVEPPALFSVTLPAGSVTGGATVTATINLNAATPTVDPILFQFALSPSVTCNIPAGHLLGAVNCPTAGVDAPFTLQGVAMDPDGVTAKAMLTLNPASISQVTVPASVIGGTSSHGYVVLNGKAGPSGATVTLSCSPPTALSSLPTSVKVAAQATNAYFAFTAGPVDTALPVTVSATYKTITKTSSVNVTPAPLAVLSVPATAIGGNLVSVTLRLNGTHPTPFPVHLYSSNRTVIPFDANVSIPANSSLLVVSVPTAGVDTATAVTLNADAGAVHLTQSVNVAKAGLSKFLLNKASVAPGGTIYGYVFLNGCAGPSGTVVNISYTGTTVTGPISVTVSPQHSSASFAMHAAANATASTTATVSLGSTHLSQVVKVSP